MKYLKLSIILIFIILLSGCTTTPQKQEPTIIPAPQETETTIITPNITVAPNMTTASTLVTKKVTGMGTILKSEMLKLVPLFTAYNDDLIANDYKKLGTDNLALRKEVESQSDYFGDTLSSSEIEGAKDFTASDKILYQKYSGYLKTFKNMVVSTELALTFINDDNSELNAADKLNLIGTALDDRNKLYDQVDTIFDSCKEYEVDCGQNDASVKLLKKKLF